MTTEREGTEMARVVEVPRSEEWESVCAGCNTNIAYHARDRRKKGSRYFVQCPKCQTRHNVPDPDAIDLSGYGN